MNFAPILLFVYNRLWHTRQTVEALKKNALASQSELFVYSDGPKNEQDQGKVQEVRHYIRSISGFKRVRVVEREKNLGLADSVVSGVTEVVDQFGRVVVLEDDLVTSPYFLKYMNDALDAYETHEDVVSIHGYIYPIEGLPEAFFLRGADCWGWATWKDAWTVFEPDGRKLLSELKRKKLTKRFDFNGTYGFTRMLKRQIAGKNNSWAVRWYASAFLQNKYTLYPGKSLVWNIGLDGSGSHCKKTDIFGAGLYGQPVNVSGVTVQEDEQALLAIEAYFKKIKAGFFVRLIRVFSEKFRVHLFRLEL